MGAGAWTSRRLVLGCAVLALGAYAGSIIPVEATAATAKRPRVVRCKRGQVKVTVGHKSTCRAFNKVFPRPRAGDPRLSFARTALGLSLRVKGLKRTPNKLKGRAGRAARKGIGAAAGIMPLVLAKIDAQAARARAAAVVPRAECGGRAPLSLTSKSTVGGASVSVRTGDTIGADVSVDVNGYRVITRLDLGRACGGFEGPSCPSAQGVLEDKGSNGFEVSVVVLHGSEVVSDTTVSLQDKLKFRGQVADDAKLQTLEVQDTVFYFVSNSGTIIQALIKRDALIDMHTLLWLPEHATVTVALLLHGGVDLGAAQRLAMQNDLTRDYDQSFPEIVNRAIKSYRGMETAWQEPGKCATLAFAPASGTLQPLAKGQAGQVTGHVVAISDGATAKSARWTVLGARNGTIKPPSAGGGSPGFSWTVTNASAGIQLEGDFKATSTAGVATATWSQPTKGNEPPLRVAGTFGGSLADSAGAFSWSGSVTFSPRNHVGGGANWSYPVDAGSVTVTASGRGGRGPAGCHWQGTRQFNFQPNSGEFHVLGSTLGTGTDLLPPYQYSSVVALLDRLMDVTTDSCDDATNNGKTVQISAAAYMLNTSQDQRPHLSPDGLTYTGSESIKDPGGTQYEFHWDFHGETT